MDLTLLSDLEELEQNKPKTQVQPQMGGGGKPPRPTAVGLSDGGFGDENFVRGQVLRCLVTDTGPRGFWVKVLGTHIRGLMVTDAYYAVNSEIQAAFMHWSPSGMAVFEPVDPPTDIGGQTDLLAASRFLPDGSQTSFQDIFGRKALDEFHNLGEEAHKFDRAVDLLPPPVKESEVTSYSGGHANLKELVDRLFAMEFNGILIGESSQFLSRGALLIRKGRCIGAIHSSNFERVPKNGESALRNLMNDLLDDGAHIDCYDLPEDLIRAYASLFVGARLEPHYRDESGRYHELLLRQFEEEKITGAINLSIALGTEQCFILVVEGAFREFFFVQSRVYGFNQDEFKRELRTRDITQVEASLLNEGDEQKVLDMRQFLPFNS